MKTSYTFPAAGHWLGFCLHALCRDAVPARQVKSRREPESVVEKWSRSTRKIFQKQREIEKGKAPSYREGSS
ncbi:unnamed protein product [Hermetia illucens]|uniref:Uncharacterized protein n=1 Tax=Hermetia illucens TaxID=343691 RepID=A0A7R8UJX7_HERIL|nr:unnamed protein product [Hermetia illucens]